MRQILDMRGITVRSQVDSGKDCWTGRVDFRRTTLPVVLEVQSEEFHVALTDAEHDKARHEQLVADGFVYDEVWDTDVWSRPWVIVEKVEALIAEAKALRAAKDDAEGGPRSTKPQRDRT